MSTAASVKAATCRSTQSQYKEGRLIFGTAPHPTDAVPQFSSRRHALTCRGEDLAQSPWCRLGLAEAASSDLQLRSTASLVGGRSVQGLCTKAAGRATASVV
jgi:hypothetical protein